MIGLDSSLKWVFVQKCHRKFINGEMPKVLKAMKSHITMERNSCVYSSAIFEI